MSCKFVTSISLLPPLLENVTNFESMKSNSITFTYVRKVKQYLPIYKRNLAHEYRDKRKKQTKEITVT